jgi:hypothetical protein
MYSENLSKVTLNFYVSRYLNGPWWQGKKTITHAELFIEPSNISRSSKKQLRPQTFILL